MDSHSGSMMLIDNTGDNVMMIDDTSDGDGGGSLDNGTTTRNRETGCRGGLVSKRVCRDEGIANGDVAIRRPLGEDSPFGLFAVAMVVASSSMARKREGCRALLFPGD